MKTTEFEQTLTMGTAEFIKFLDSILVTGMIDKDVTSEIYEHATDLGIAVHDAFDEYTERTRKMYAKYAKYEND